MLCSYFNSIARHAGAAFYMGEIVMREARFLETKRVVSDEDENSKETVYITTNHGILRDLHQIRNVNHDGSAEERVEVDAAMGYYDDLLEFRDEVTGTLHQNALGLVSEEKRRGYDFTITKGSEEEDDIDTFIETYDSKKMFKDVLEMQDAKHVADGNLKKYEILEQKNRDVTKSSLAMLTPKHQKIEYPEKSDFASKVAEARKNINVVKDKDLKIVRRPKHSRVHPEDEKLLNEALGFYISASSKGALLATHRVGHMLARGIGTAKSCMGAVTAFRSIAERGNWNYELTLASRHVDAGRYAAALRIYNKFAVMGYESAQANAAYIVTNLYCPSWLAPMENSEEDHLVSTLSKLPASLKRHRSDQASIFKVENIAGISNDIWTAYSRLNNVSQNENDFVGTSLWSKLLNFTKIFGNSDADHKYSKADCEERAMSLYALSALQNSGESYTKIGDMFYHGLGALDVDEKMALNYYKVAAALKHTNALFSVGLMHEFGEGVQHPDFLLAKRFYDQAGANDPGAAPAARMANQMLKVCLWMFTIHIHSIIIPSFDVIVIYSSTVYLRIDLVATLQKMRSIRCVLLSKAQFICYIISILL